MEMVYLCGKWQFDCELGQISGFIKDSGILGCSMEREFNTIHKGKREREFGIMDNLISGLVDKG